MAQCFQIWLATHATVILSTSIRLPWADWSMVMGLPRIHGWGGDGVPGFIYLFILL